MSTGKNNEAIALIDELKEKFEDSAKLNNLKAAAYISLGKLEQAVAILNKLYTVLTNKEQFYDQSELETALANLIVCSLYQGANYDEYLKYAITNSLFFNANDLLRLLSDVNPDHSFLKTLL